MSRRTEPYDVRTCAGGCGEKVRPGKITPANIENAKRFGAWCADCRKAKRASIMKRKVTIREHKATAAAARERYSAAFSAPYQSDVSVVGGNSSLTSDGPISCEDQTGRSPLLGGQSSFAGPRPLYRRMMGR